ncbi:MAG: response regulator transcription factor [Candidatus Dormibacteraeota bacterium]|nr:response regulator transcription factor [Candidatus Dormibacteraeota bacterium]
MILVVDDDPKIVVLVRAYLVAAGFAVITAPDGDTALEKIRTQRPRLIVLDLMLPGTDGLEVTRRVREESHVPILMLTAKGAVADRLAGFSKGADDYLAKPFSPAELVARVQAILRRTVVDDDPLLLRHGDLEMDLARHEVRRAGRSLDVSQVEFQLLVALLQAGGRVLSRDQLIDAAGTPDPDGVLQRSIDVYISRLRHKLGDDSEHPSIVATVRGAGYRLAKYR